MARQSFPESELAVLHLTACHVERSRDISYYLKKTGETVRDSSTPLGMTKKANLAILVVFALAGIASPQESPTPTASPTQTPSSTLTPEQTPSAAPSRNAQLKFVPPPMEGTISLGIFDSNGKLVRVLHREATTNDFRIDENSLNTTWDGKNDAGETLLPGKYRARGYMVARFKVEDLGKAANPPADAASDHVSVKLVTNPLVSDTRSVVDIGVGFDGKGSFLKTMDGLPLFTVSATPNLVRVLITKNGEKSADVWQDDGAAVEQIRVSNIDKMMAFDCGDFELK